MGDLAVLHADDAVCEAAGEFVVVGDEEEGGLAILKVVEEPCDDLGGGGGVEVAGEFVGEEDGGLVAYRLFDTWNLLRSWNLLCS